MEKITLITTDLFVDLMLKNKCNQARWEYLKDLTSNMHGKKEHKLFWNYVNSKRKLLTDECDISERMNKFFTRENLENIPSFQQIIVDDSPSFLQCSVDLVTKLLKEVRPRKSPGPDGIES